MSDTTKYGVANVTPTVAHAGKKGTWTVEYTVGASGIKQGGGLRLIQPLSAHDLWPLGKVTAFCDNPQAFLDVYTDKAYPMTFHHSNYPSVTVTVFGTDLQPGEKVRIVLGAVGGYVSGRFVRAEAFRHTGDFDFNLLVDPKGNANFVRERHRPEAYHPVAGDLTVTVRPDTPARIRCALRCSPTGAADLIGVVAAEDAYENPIADIAFPIRLSVEQGTADLPAAVEKPGGQEGGRFAAKVSGGEVVYVGATSYPHGIYGLSSPVCRDFTGKGHGIYFGDMHVMTGSGGNPQMCGTSESAIRYARDVFGLDWTAITNGDAPATWRADRALFEQYNKDHDFVTMPAYECGLRTGHKNVYYIDGEPPDEVILDADALWRHLRGTTCMAITHTSNTHSETDPDLSWSPLKIETINPAFERLIEISQNRGSFEVDEIGGEVSFGGFGSSIRDILARGYRLGFVGGTDNHRARPGSTLSNQSGLDSADFVGGGITGVLCKELTRSAVWDALFARRCYATTSVRMLLDVDLNGHTMGEDIAISGENRDAFATRTLRVRAAGTTLLDRIVIVRNGEEVHTESVNGLTAEVTWQDDAPLADVNDADIGGVYYYAKVYQADRNVGWASPIWLSY